MIRKVFGILVLACLFATPSFAKMRVSLGDVSGNGVSQREIDTVEQLMQSEIMAHDDAQLVPARSDMRLSANITRLRRSYILTMYAQYKDDEDSENTKLRDFDEIDVAVKRLVAAMIEKVDLDKTAERGEVLEEEQREPTRVKSIQGWEVAVGGAYPWTGAIDDQKGMFAFGIGYFFDVDPFFLELRTDFQLGYDESDMNFTTFTIGGHYFLVNGRRTSLYSGVELGFGAVSDSDADSTSGFVAGFDVGVMLLRHADINIDVRLRNTILARELNGKMPFTSALMIGFVF